MFLFKVDFEKAFDSVNWSFLFHTMEQMGFGSKWIGWIQGCLQSASISILVNGAPSKEFHMERGLRASPMVTPLEIDPIGDGLRQGDPLSPFLFLLAGEALQQMFLVACNSGLFKGLRLENSNRNLSLMQFADDALIIFVLTKILNSFHEVSGIRINLSKCNLYGIGVSDMEVKDVADRIGCKASHLPFIYLGLPVGSNMKKSASWTVVVEKVSKKLSSWKANSLSIGGRFILTQSVLYAVPLFFFSLFKAPPIILKALKSLRRKFFWGHSEDSTKLNWVAWKKILLAKSNGGLGIVSFKIRNEALLAKWIWRFFTSKEAIWKDVIVEFYGIGGGLSSPNPLTVKSTWAEIVNCCKGLKIAGQNFHSSFSRIHSKDSQALFWKELRVREGSTLMDCYPRLFALEKEKNALFKDRWKFSNGTWYGAWDWSRNLKGGALDDL
ncbi:hypothetical protein OSB04_010658 [Centaurea solstitialis]|uniref:Reverse transcriptase domain-containing protein n=1 Tax=Centaurea solstitialis TaxID=347529 RepID=A0AA38T9P5_9ASTR|nr:hypothetical protein OSB04_010658 [Centaurea solstitialis]